MFMGGTARLKLACAHNHPEQGQEPYCKLCGAYVYTTNTKVAYVEYHPTVQEVNVSKAVTIAQETIKPAIDPKGKPVVAFFEGSGLQFVIPTDTEADAVQLALRFQDLYVKMMDRYLQSPIGTGDVHGAETENQKDST